MSRRIRVLLADDHTLVRVGLRKVLEQNGDLVVVGEVSDGPAAASEDAWIASAMPAQPQCSSSA